MPYSIPQILTTTVFQGATGSADTQELKIRVLNAGKHCSEAYKELLETISMVTNHCVARTAVTSCTLLRDSVENSLHIDIKVYTS